MSVQENGEVGDHSQDPAFYSKPIPVLGKPRLLTAQATINASLLIHSFPSLRSLPTNFALLHLPLSPVLYVLLRTHIFPFEYHLQPHITVIEHLMIEANSGGP